MALFLKRITFGCALVVSCAAMGCGGIGGADSTSSQEKAIVKGKVTVGGKPLGGAEVAFNPSNVNRKTAPVATSAIKDDGTYEVTTLVGQNQVTLTGPGVANKPQLSYFSKTIDVQSGTNELEIAIP